MTRVYLIKRENGRWYAKYQTATGTWTHHSLATSHKATAQVRFAQFLKELEERRLLFSNVRPLPLREFKEEYLRYVKSHKSSSWYQRQTSYIERIILPFFGQEILTTQITSRRIEQYTEARRTKVKGTTVNKELACIRHMMKKAEEWGNLLTSPARKVKDLPDDGQIRERFLTQDEYSQLLRAAQKRTIKHWALPNEPFDDLSEFIMLGCNTGLRLSEILTLEFSDVDLARRILRLRNKPHLNFHIKNYQERHIPLNEDAIGALRSLLARKHPGSNFVFHKRNGSRWTTIHDSFDALVEKCKLQAEAPFNVTPHTLRHTFGSWLAIAGVPLRGIQKLMGHRSIVTTERYAHLSAENLRTAVEKIQALLPKTLPSAPKVLVRHQLARSLNIRKNWCGGPESNRHVPYGTRDFKSLASTSSATPAQLDLCRGYHADEFLSSCRRAGAAEFAGTDSFTDWT